MLCSLLCSLLCVSVTWAEEPAAVEAPAVEEAPSSYSGQVIGRNLVDHDYDFRIERLDESWSLRGEADMRTVSPDAVAGALVLGAFTSMVIVEPASTSTPKAHARILLDTLELVDKQVLTYEDELFQGKPAVHYVAQGRIDGVLYAYDNTVILHDGHLFQLLTYGTPGAGYEPEMAERVRRAFSFMEQGVEGRRQAFALPDCSGPGWRLQDGAFLSAAHGIAVEPIEHWYVSVGADLLNMSDAAEVGLVAAGAGSYLTVTSEPIAGVDPGWYRDLTMDTVLRGMGVRPTGELRELEVSGQRQPFVVGELRFGGLEMETLMAVVVVDGVAHQVLAWGSKGEGNPAFEELPQAIAALRFLDAPAREAARAELATSATPVAYVGEGWSLREGVYEDYRLQLSWAPTGTWWRLSAGDAALAMDPRAVLVVNAPELGVWGFLSSEETPLSDRAFHEAYRGRYMGGSWVGKPERAKLIGGKGLRSAYEMEGGPGRPSRELLLTTVHQGHGLALQLYGLPENMRAAEPVLIEASAQLTLLDAPIEALTIGAEGVVDRRLGWQLTQASPAFKGCQAAGPDEIAPQATIVRCQSGGDLLMVTASQTADSGQSVEVVLSEAEATMRRAFDSLGEGDFSREEVTFAGQPAVRMRHVGPTGEVRYTYLLYRGTLYGVFVALGQGSRRDPDQVEAGFSLR